MRQRHSKLFFAAQCSLMNGAERDPQHYRTSTTGSLTQQALSVLAALRNGAYRAVLTISRPRW